MGFNRYTAWNCDFLLIIFGWIGPQTVKGNATVQLSNFEMNKKFSISLFIILLWCKEQKKNSTISGVS